MSFFPGQGYGGGQQHGGGGYPPPNNYGPPPPNNYGPPPQQNYGPPPPQQYPYLYPKPVRAREPAPLTEMAALKADTMPIHPKRLHLLSLDTGTATTNHRLLFPPDPTAEDTSR